MSARVKARGRKLANSLIERGPEGWREFPRQIDVVLDAAGAI